MAAVAERGPAAAAGLRRGDVLASVRGAEIADLGDFYRKVWNCGAAGVEIPIEIIRDGRALGVRLQSADRQRVPQAAAPAVSVRDLGAARLSAPAVRAPKARR